MMARVSSPLTCGTKGAALLLSVLLLLALAPPAAAQCSGSCNACARRFGCMTAAWGKCCTQFFMHNGKRAAPSSSQALKRARSSGREDLLRLIAGQQREPELFDSGDYDEPAMLRDLANTLLWGGRPTEDDS